MIPDMLAVLSGAFLVFQIQPLLSKHILPWFGGTASVWTTSVLFFQVVLLAGYIYAHLLDRYLSVAGQRRLHSLLLFVGLAMMFRHGWETPVLPSAAWKDYEVAAPTRHLLLLLLANIGVPFLALSATSPLIQAWTSRQNPGRSPYMLYALSNAGSLAALASYPMLVERVLTLPQQAWLWAAGFFVLLLATLLSGRKTATAAPESAAAPMQQKPVPTAAPTGIRIILAWLVPSACASLMFLAVTTQLCQNIASIPFLWILPLALYLISFIVTFSGDSLYPRRLLLILLLPALGVLATLTAEGFRIPRVWNAPVALPALIMYYSVSLLVVCLVCHGELYRARPPADRLTFFYLVIASGGVLGGFIVSVLAPLCFPIYLELRIGVLLCYVFGVAAMWWRPPTRCSRKSPIRYVTLAAASAGFLGLGFLLFDLMQTNARCVVHGQRNFYGVLRVRETETSQTGLRRTLLCGNIHHGMQFIDQRLRRWPTMYYHPDSGIGLALRSMDAREHLRVGIVGLGTGTLACYAEEGDVFRFYELNPGVIDIADGSGKTRLFTYLGDARARGATIEIVPGDARRMLEKDLAEGRLPEDGFDLLVIDAFSSDAIPVHLLTAEAFALYKRLLRPDGMLACHLTNRYLSLVPVAGHLARHAGLNATHVCSNPAGALETVPSDWVLASPDATVLQHPLLQKAGAPVAREARRLWTDQYSSLFSAIR